MKESYEEVPPRSVEEDKVTKLVTDKALAVNGFTHRQDWGNLNGQKMLPLNWGAVNCNSRVFVSISEWDLNQCGLVGAARYTVHNVAARNGGVNVWVNIEWDNPIRIRADYLVINP
jgi:hypothetical protein